MYKRLKFASAVMAWLLTWQTAPPAMAASLCDAAPTPECIIEEAVAIGRSGDEELHIWTQTEAGSAWHRLGSPHQAREHFDAAFTLWRKTYRKTGVVPRITERIAKVFTSAGDTRGALMFDDIAKAIVAYDGPWPYDIPAPFFKTEERAEYLSIELHGLAWARSKVGDAAGAAKTAAMAPSDVIEANLLVLAAGTLARNGFVAGGPVVLTRAEQMWSADKKLPEWKKKFDLADYIDTLAWLGRQEEALRYADDFFDGKERDSVISSVSDIYAKRGEFETAQRIAELIHNDKKREYALWEVAFRFAQSGEITEVKKLLSRLTIPDDFDFIYDAMAATRAVEGDIDSAIEFVERHYKNSKPSYRRQLAMETIVRRLVEAGDINGMEKVVAHMDQESRMNRIREIAAMRAEAGNINDAFSTARSAVEPKQKIQALISVALGMEGVVCVYYLSSVQHCR